MIYDERGSAFRILDLHYRRPSSFVDRIRVRAMENGKIQVARVYSLDSRVSLGGIMIIFWTLVAGSERLDRAYVMSICYEAILG